jgi:mannose-1-phosphate guanylyltransferase
MAHADPTSAMILAAGRGTRLAPLTQRCAKPLVPIGDRPALAHIVDGVRAAGIRRIVVNAFHRAEDVCAFAARETGIAVSDEAARGELLGTAGGVAHARSLLGEGDILVWNGDVLAEPDIAALREAHALESASSGVLASLAVLPRARGAGNIGVGRGGRIVRIRSERAPGEPEAAEIEGGYFIGVHILGAGLRSALPVRGCLVGDVYLPALRRREALHAFRYEGPFFDVGTLEQYLEANLAWLDRRGPGESFRGAGAAIDPPVVLERSVVGAGASVRGAGPLTRCVVWPGARATAPLSDAIVLDDLVLGIGDGARLA